MNEPNIEKGVLSETENKMKQESIEEELMPTQNITIETRSVAKGMEMIMEDERMRIEVRGVTCGSGTKRSATTIWG